MMTANNYAPQTLSECTVCPSQGKEIHDFFAQNPYGTLFLVGPHGSGKTTVARLALAELGYIVRFYDSVSAKNDKLRQELLNLNHNNVVSRLSSSNAPPKKVAIIIDNFDSIALSSEKTVIDELITYNASVSKIPIVVVVTSSSLSNKIIDDYRKCSTIAFPTPSHDVMLDMTDLVATGENVEFADSEAVEEIVRHIQGDLRCLLTTIHDLALCFGPGTTISREVFLGYVNDVSERKCRNLSLFEAYREMFGCQGDVGRLTSIYNTDKVLLPLTLHENYYREIDPKLSAQEKLRLIQGVSERISKGDLVETDIYSDQSWQLQDMHCFISCVQPINALLMTGTPVPPEVPESLSFSSELNKTSLKNINRKNFSNAQNICPGLDEIEDVLELSRILGDLILQDREEDLRKVLLNIRNCSDVLRLTETIIKIDKCNPHISTISTKWKKQYAGNIMLES